MASQSSNSQQQGLPSIQSLTNGLPRPSGQQISPGDRPQGEQLRDSDNSANSGLQVHTLLNPGPDESPTRNSVPNTPQSARAPTSAHSVSSQLPSINQGFQDSGHRASVEYSGTLDSRRSSIESRMHQGFGNLYINNPASPYESANASQVSLAASLRRPGNGVPMSPLSGRSSLRGQPMPMRQAPQIMPINRAGPDPTAAKPTLGHAWAFPDAPIPEERRTSDSGESSVGVSRTNSFAASSIRSSIFSTDSHMPHGQRRFDDDQTTHHHTMQHRAVQSLQTEGTPPAGIGNYSRTPELRVSHKLAERKRRSEMKDLFEDLNKAVPANGGTKASKWEILTKAIEYIRSCQHTERALQVELQRLQRDADYAREAHTHNEALKTEIQVMQQHLRRLDSNATHIYGPYTQQLNQPGPNQANGGVALPPLHSAAPAPSAQPSYGNGVQGHPPGAMQGVEYGGYRG